MIDAFPEQEIFHHSGFEIYLTNELHLFRIQAFDHGLSLLFQLEVKADKEISILTNDLCKSKGDLYKVLSQAFSQPSSKSIICNIDHKGVLHYQCSLLFPIEKTISFEILLEKTDVSDIKLAEMHIASLAHQVGLLEKQFKLKEDAEACFSDNENLSLSFSNTFNNKAFFFSNDNKTIIRNKEYNGQFVSVWGDRFLKRHGKQAFEVKIEAINENFNHSLAIIGVNKIDYMGNTVYKSMGCYNLTKEKVYFEGCEFNIGAVFFKGDIIKVIVDFQKEEVSWFQNNERITTVKFFKDEEDFDLYPVVTLKYENESVSFL